MEWERGVETLLNPSRKLFNSFFEPHGLTMISIYAYSNLEFSPPTLFVPPTVHVFSKFLYSISFPNFLIKKIPIAPRGGERIWTLESGKRVGVGNAQFSTKQTNKQTHTLQFHGLVVGSTAGTQPRAWLHEIADQGLWNFQWR